jgi:hypothetical protein
MIEKRIMCYTAGPMEAVSSEEMTGWRNQVREKLEDLDVLVYDPVQQESKKVGKKAGEQIKYINNLKRAGHWDKFYREMFRIWFGAISPNTDVVQVLQHLRMRKHIETDSEKYFKYMGDAEAVVRSDFIVVYVPKDVRMVGTLFEVTIAFLFNVPMYLIIPDDTNTATNSSLLFGNQMCNNGNLKSFYTVEECIEKIKHDYNL